VRAYAGPMPRNRSASLAVAAGALLLAAAGFSPLDEFEPVSTAPVLEIPDPVPELSRAQPGPVARGRYLVGMLGCANCHTDGALIGEPHPQRALAGSRIGIAVSNPLEDPRPGVVYPGNITPDVRTGTGAWSDEALIRVIRTGIDAYGRRHLPVMPWPIYANIADDDVLAIVAYLRAIPPIEFEVPANVRRGEEATAPFVHFGVYRSRHFSGPDGR
jgi:hypothetical protein